MRWSLRGTLTLPPLGCKAIASSSCAWAVGQRLRRDIPAKAAKGEHSNPLYFRVGTRGPNLPILGRRHPHLLSPNRATELLELPKVINSGAEPRRYHRYRGR